MISYRDASMMWLRRELVHRQPQELTEEEDQPVTQTDVEDAIKQIRPSTTSALLKQYEDFMRDHGAA